MAFKEEELQPHVRYNPLADASFATSQLQHLYHPPAIDDAAPLNFSSEQKRKFLHTSPNPIRVDQYVYDPVTKKNVLSTDDKLVTFAITPYDGQGKGEDICRRNNTYLARGISSDLKVSSGQVEQMTSGLKIWGPSFFSFENLPPALEGLTIDANLLGYMQEKFGHFMQSQAEHVSDANPLLNLSLNYITKTLLNQKAMLAMIDQDLRDGAISDEQAAGLRADYQFFIQRQLTLKSDQSHNTGGLTPFEYNFLDTPRSIRGIGGATIDLVPPLSLLGGFESSGDMDGVWKYMFNGNDPLAANTGRSIWGRCGFDKNNLSHFVWLSPIKRSSNDGVEFISPDEAVSTLVPQLEEWIAKIEEKLADSQLMQKLRSDLRGLGISDDVSVSWERKKAVLQTIIERLGDEDVSNDQAAYADYLRLMIHMSTDRYYFSQDSKFINTRPVVEDELCDIDTPTVIDEGGQTRYLVHSQDVAGSMLMQLTLDDSPMRGVLFIVPDTPYLSYKTDAQMLGIGEEGGRQQWQYSDPGTGLPLQGNLSLGENPYMFQADALWKVTVTSPRLVYDPVSISARLVRKLRQSNSAAFVVDDHVEVRGSDYFVQGFYPLKLQSESPDKPYLLSTELESRRIRIFTPTSIFESKESEPLYSASSGRGLVDLFKENNFVFSDSDWASISKPDAAGSFVVEANTRKVYRIWRGTDGNFGAWAGPSFIYEAVPFVASEPEIQKHTRDAKNFKASVGLTPMYSSLLGTRQAKEMVNMDGDNSEGFRLSVTDKQIQNLGNLTNISKLQDPYNADVFGHWVGQMTNIASPSNMPSKIIVDMNRVFRERYNSASGQWELDPNIKLKPAQVEALLGAKLDPTSGQLIIDAAAGLDAHGREQLTSILKNTPGATYFDYLFIHHITVPDPSEWQTPNSTTKPWIGLSREQLNQYTGMGDYTFLSFMLAFRRASDALIDDSYKTEVIDYNKVPIKTAYPQEILGYKRDMVTFIADMVLYDSKRAHLWASLLGDLEFSFVQTALLTGGPTLQCKLGWGEWNPIKEEFDSGASLRITGILPIGSPTQSLFGPSEPSPLTSLSERQQVPGMPNGMGGMSGRIDNMLGFGLGAAGWFKILGPVNLTLELGVLKLSPVSRDPINPKSWYPKNTAAQDYFSNYVEPLANQIEENLNQARQGQISWSDAFNNISGLRLQLDAALSGLKPQLTNGGDEKVDAARMKAGLPPGGSATQNFSELKRAIDDLRELLFSDVRYNGGATSDTRVQLGRNGIIGTSAITGKSEDRTYSADYSITQSMTLPAAKLGLSVDLFETKEQRSTISAYVKGGPRAVAEIMSMVGGEQFSGVKDLPQMQDWATLDMDFNYYRQLFGWWGAGIMARTNVPALHVRDLTITSDVKPLGDNGPIASFRYTAASPSGGAYISNFNVIARWNPTLRQLLKPFVSGTIDWAEGISLPIGMNYGYTIMPYGTSARSESFTAVFGLQYSIGQDYGTVRQTEEVRKIEKTLNEQLSPEFQNMEQYTQPLSNPHPILTFAPARLLQSNASPPAEEQPKEDLPSTKPSVNKGKETKKEKQGKKTKTEQKTDNKKTKTKSQKEKLEEVKTESDELSPSKPSVQPSESSSSWSTPLQKASDTPTGATTQPQTADSSKAASPNVQEDEYWKNKKARRR